MKPTNKRFSNFCDLGQIQKFLKIWKKIFYTSKNKKQVHLSFYSFVICFSLFLAIFASFSILLFLVGLFERERPLGSGHARVIEIKRVSGSAIFEWILEGKTGFFDLPLPPFSRKNFVIWSFFISPNRTRFLLFLSQNFAFIF